MTRIGLAHVRAALALADFDPAEAQRQMAPQPRPPSRRKPGAAPTPRQAGVLLLLYPIEGGDLALVLIRRTENEHDVHGGQISLPGGAQEPGESLIETALRESREELGLTDQVDVLGLLAALYIPPSGFDVQPVVGYINRHPIWQPEISEVTETIECPLAWLLDDQRKVVEEWDYQGYNLRVPWYHVAGHRVWGATAIILSEFEQRLRRVLGGTQSASEG